MPDPCKEAEIRMRAFTAVFALGVALVAGGQRASANELEFPDADENGPDHFVSAAPAPRLLAAPVVVRHIPMPPKVRLVAAPVEVRLIPMPPKTAAAAPAKPAPAPAPAPAPSVAELDFPDADEN
jgi:hypothetical protein